MPDRTTVEETADVAAVTAFPANEVETTITTWGRNAVVVNVKVTTGDYPTDDLLAAAREAIEAAVGEHFGPDSNGTVFPGTIRVTFDTDPVAPTVPENMLPYDDFVAQMTAYLEDAEGIYAKHSPELSVNRGQYIESGVTFSVTLTNTETVELEEATVKGALEVKARELLTAGDWVFKTESPVTANVTVHPFTGGEEPGTPEGPDPNEVIYAITLPIRFHSAANSGPNATTTDSAQAYADALLLNANTVAAEGEAGAYLLNVPFLGFTFPTGREIVVQISKAEFDRVTTQHGPSNGNSNNAYFEHAPWRTNNVGKDIKGFTNMNWFRMGYDRTGAKVADVGENLSYEIEAIDGTKVIYFYNNNQNLPASNNPLTGITNTNANRAIGVLLHGPRSAFVALNLEVVATAPTPVVPPLPELLPYDQFVSGLTTFVAQYNGANLEVLSDAAYSKSSITVNLTVQNTQDDVYVQNTVRDDVRAHALSLLRAEGFGFRGQITVNVTVNEFVPEGMMEQIPFTEALQAHLDTTYPTALSRTLTVTTYNANTIVIRVTLSVLPGSGLTSVAAEAAITTAVEGILVAGNTNNFVFDMAGFSISNAANIVQEVQYEMPDRAGVLTAATTAAELAFPVAGDVTAVVTTIGDFDRDLVEVRVRVTTLEDPLPPELTTHAAIEAAVRAALPANSNGATFTGNITVTVTFVGVLNPGDPNEVIYAVTLPIRHTGNVAGFSTSASSFPTGSTNAVSGAVDRLWAVFGHAEIVTTADILYGTGVVTAFEETVVQIANTGEVPNNAFDFLTLGWTQDASSANGIFQRAPGTTANNLTTGANLKGFTSIRMFRLSTNATSDGRTGNQTWTVFADNTPFPIKAIGTGEVIYTLRNGRSATELVTPADGHRQIGYILVGPRSAFTDNNLKIVQNAPKPIPLPPLP
jgi:hypothetical protein